MSRSGLGRIYTGCVKRILDVLFASLLLALLLPFMLLIALAIRIDSRGGAIFRQRRIGRGAKEFTCYKFRTMHISAPASIPASRFEDYAKSVTRVGRFLRKTSLDELPQLFNVLRGDMSLVGPRPLIGEEGDIHKARSDIGVYALRPGITGMAQVSGRNRISNEEKLRQDAYYLDNLGILLDAKIVIRTLRNVICREGVEAVGGDRGK